MKWLEGILTESAVQVNEMILKFEAKMVEAEGCQKKIDEMSMKLEQVQELVDEVAGELREGLERVEREIEVGVVGEGRYEDVEDN